MTTPREFKKKLWFPYVFAGLAFLYTVTHTLNWIFMGYSFSLYMFFNYVLPDIAILGAGVCLILFGRKKPKETILPLSLIFGLQIVSYIYLTFKYTGQNLIEYAIFSAISAVIFALILLFYILNVSGILRQRTLLIIFDIALVAVEFVGLVSALIPTFTHQDYSGILIVTINVLAVIFYVSQTILFSLPIWYVFSLKKIEPQVIKIALTMQDKITIIDKLYLMFQKGEITEAEYLEKKKSILKEI